MNELTGLLSAIAAIVGAVGGLVVAILAIRQWKDANDERKRANEQHEAEVRWRQAEEARRVLDDLFLSDKHAGYDALLMVDLPPGADDVFEDCRYSKRTMRTVSHENVIQALQQAIGDQDPGEVGAFIWACFDDMFYYLDRIGYFLAEKRLALEDVRSPLDYYAEKMAAHWADYEGYAHKIRAEKALGLLRQFPGWKRGAAAAGLPG